MVSGVPVAEERKTISAGKDPDISGRYMYVHLARRYRGREGGQMRFTSMFRYGLRALAVLVRNYGKGPVSAKEISEKEGISSSFLEQLLAQLRRNGIVVGVRGPGGGFKLAKAPSKIEICDIVRALEGPVCASKCLLPESDPSNEHCDKMDTCSIVRLLRKIEKDLIDVFCSYTLADLKK